MITVSNKNNLNNSNTDRYNSNNNNDNNNEQRIINNLTNNKLFNIESSIHLGKRNRNENFILNSNNKKQKKLLYLSICIRPDIISLISKAARRSKEPNMEDWNNVMRILRYLKGTKKFGINFTNNPNVKAYVDSDYGGDLETRRSTTGFLITFGGAPTNWCSKIQKSI